MDDRERAMRRASELGLEFLAGLGERHVGAVTDAASLAAELGRPLPDEGEDPEVVVEGWRAPSIPASSPRPGRGTSDS